MPNVPLDPERAFAEAVFRPHWPAQLDPQTSYQVVCDDKGPRAEATATLAVMIAGDGDVHVSMHERDNDEDAYHGDAGARWTPFPSVRVRTLAGGGRNLRTRQALLWLALAIKLDAEDGGRGAPAGEAG